jgi:hypothetical protein
MKTGFEEYLEKLIRITDKKYEGMNNLLALSNSEQKPDNNSIYKNILSEKEIINKEIAELDLEFDIIYSKLMNEANFNRQNGFNLGNYDKGNILKEKVNNILEITSKINSIKEKAGFQISPKAFKYNNKKAIRRNASYSDYTTVHNDNYFFDSKK